MAKEPTDRLSVTLPKRLKRRLKDLAADSNNMSMNDLVIEAIKDYVDRLDAKYSAPDLVYDRLGQILTTQMFTNQELQTIKNKLEEIDDRI